MSMMTGISSSLGGAGGASSAGGAASPSAGGAAHPRRQAQPHPRQRGRLQQERPLLPQRAPLVVRLPQPGPVELPRRVLRPPRQQTRGPE